MSSRSKRERTALLDRSFPNHLAGTAAEWRQAKRQEWKAVMDALSAFEKGSAYTTAGNDLHWIRQRVDTVWENLQGDWIAWTPLPVKRKRH